jgi:hypothetical protein
MRSFKDWWNSSVPSDLQQKIRKGDENNKPLKSDQLCFIATTFIW